jgi:hypothetical protein
MGLLLPGNVERALPHEGEVGHKQGWNGPWPMVFDEAHQAIKKLGTRPLSVAELMGMDDKQEKMFLDGIGRNYATTLEQRYGNTVVVRRYKNVWMEQGTGSYKCGEISDLQGKRILFF